MYAFRSPRYYCCHLAYRRNIACPETVIAPKSHDKLSPSVIEVTTCSGTQVPMIFFCARSVAPGGNTPCNLRYGHECGCAARVSFVGTNQTQRTGCNRPAQNRKPTKLRAQSLACQLQTITTKNPQSFRTFQMISFSSLVAPPVRSFVVEKDGLRSTSRSEVRCPRAPC